MNRAFLIVVIPAILAAVAYWIIFRHLQIQPNYLRLAGAVLGFLAAIVLVRRYRAKNAKRAGQ